MNSLVFEKDAELLMFQIHGKKLQDELKDLTVNQRDEVR
jgi:hypothetical protein